MHKLIYLKEIPKYELEAIKLFYKRMGRDALWAILEVLDDAEDRLTKEQISQKINYQNIGQDLRFLTFMNIINRKYVSPGDDHTYTYEKNYNMNTNCREKYFVPSKYNVLACELKEPDRLMEFLITFSPKKRKL